MLRRQLNDMPPARQVPALLQSMERFNDLPAYLDSLKG
jgi:hypothetical protein